MSNTSILSVIQYYQRSIEKYQTDENRLLHCVSKLYKLPVKVEHLQETGIGKTVNSLRKFEGEIGAAAKALVAKWKAMVAAEEEPMDTDCNDNETNTLNGNDDETDDENHHDQNKNSYNPEHSERSPQSTKELSRFDEQPKSKDKEHHEKSSSSSHHKSSSSSSKNHDSSSKHKSNSSKFSSSSCDKKKSHSDSHPKNRAKDDEDNKEGKMEKVKEKRVLERNNDEKLKTTSSSSSRHKDGSNSQTKEHSNNSEKHHSSKSKSSSDSHKESTHKHSSQSSHSSKERKDHEKSSASKEQEENKKNDVALSKEKHKSTSKEREHNHEKNKQKSSSKSKSTSSSHGHKTKESTSMSKDHLEQVTSSQTTAERKRHRHISEEDSSIESVAQKPKVAKQKKAIATAEENDNDEADFIDSSMGANFADVLGMLNMPAKKSKKLSSSLKSPIAASVKTSPTTNSKSASSSSKDSHHKSNSSGVSSSSKMNGIKSSPSSVASTSKSSDLTKPDLLSSKTKLEPLDPSIALELPTISNNYKPMPLNQTVMDCVFASSSSSSYSSAPKAPVRTLTDAEALKHGISSKTMRTKIYSGVRTGQLMQVPTLFDLCIRVLQKNIDALEYTGGVPFEVLRPVLDRATPQQLLIFEEYNPYLMEDSDVLWQQHVQRHYRAQKRKEMESWREMFLRCQEDQERKLNILAESIKQSQKIITAPVRKTQLAFVDSMVKPPRNVLRKQEQYGTKSKLVATPAARVASLSSVTPNAAKTGDTRLRVAASVRDHAQVSSVVRPKKAPLMAKTLQFIRGRQKR